MAIDYKKEGRIAIFTINRPRALNAMDMEASRELHEAMVDFRDDPELWVGIITGAGEKAFCVGVDIKDALSYIKEHGLDIKDAQPFIQEQRDSPWAFPAARYRGCELWKPFVAAVNGVAVGGGLEIALACDIRVASENARFGAPEVNLGLLPGWGATQRLPKMIPWCKAAEMLLIGKPIDAQEAYRIGLVNKVVPQEQLMPTAKGYAEAICQAGPLGVRAAKEAMTRASSLTLEDGLRLESSLFSYLLGTEDCAEGIAAFLEKRKPMFKAK